MRATIRLPEGGYKSNLTKEQLINLLGKIEDRHKTQLYKSGDIVWCAGAGDSSVVKATVKSCKRTSYGIPWQYTLVMVDDPHETLVRSPSAIYESQEYAAAQIAEQAREKELLKQKGPFLRELWTNFDSNVRLPQLAKTDYEQDWLDSWERDYAKDLSRQITANRKEKASITDALRMFLNTEYPLPEREAYMFWNHIRHFTKTAETTASKWNKLCWHFPGRHKEIQNVTVLPDLVSAFIKMYELTEDGLKAITG